MAKQQGKRRATWPFLVVVVLVCAAGAAWRLGMPIFADLGLEKKNPPKTAESPTLASAPVFANGEVTVPADSPYRSRITIAPVEAEAIREVHSFPAVVEADPARTINVLPPLGGRVTELKVQLGETVTAGQALVAIESGDLAQAQADIDKAKATVALTQKALDRARELTRIGGGALKDQEQATSDYSQAQAEQRRAEIRLATIAGKAQIAGERRLVINAPMSGTITALSTAAGSYINDPTQSLMTISNLESVYVTANVPETDISLVRVGEDVEFSLIAYPRRVFHGHVTSISGLLDADTRRSKVRISYDNKELLLKPNMFATASFVPPAVQALTVPTAALLMNNDNTTVFVETKPWTFKRRTIDPGPDAGGGKVVVLGGLSAGERIVVRGGVLLND